MCEPAPLGPLRENVPRRSASEEGKITPSRRRHAGDWDPITGKLIVLALAAAFYPTLLAVVILIITRPQPARLLLGFLIGGMLTSVTVGFVLLRAIEGTGTLSDGSGGTLSPAIDLILGCLSLAIAFVLATGRESGLVERTARRKELKAKPEKPAKDPWTKRILERGSVPLAVMLGVALDLPSVWYLAALKDIAHANHSTGQDLVSILVFNVIMFALIEIPLVYYLVTPDRAAATVARFDAWARGHMRQIGVSVTTVIGLYLIANGLAGLL